MQFEMPDISAKAENLKFLANLVELALYAPDGEITFEGRAALQRAAREIVVLSAEVTRMEDTIQN